MTIATQPVAKVRRALFDPLTSDERTRFEDALHWCGTLEPWDETLWWLLANDEGDHPFNGNAKEANSAFVRGLRIALHDPEYFTAWHDGFVEALGISIHTMVEKLEEKLEEEDA